MHRISGLFTGRGPLTDNDPRARPTKGYGRNSIIPTGRSRPKDRSVAPAVNSRLCQINPTSKTFNMRDPTTAMLAATWNPAAPTILFNTHTIQLPKKDFMSGMIINTVVFQEDSNPYLSRGSIHTSMSAFCNVYGKPRYLIVTQLHETHYQALPIYCHGGKGLQGKESYEHDFVSVRDGRIKQNFEALSVYLPLVTNGQGPFLDPKSVLHFTHPISRRYELKIDVCGSLRPESVKELKNYILQQTSESLGM